MKSDFYESINKGIPISVPIIIKESDLIQLTKDESMFIKELARYYKKYIDYLITFSKRLGFNIYSTMEIRSDPKTLEKKLYFSKSGFVSSILFALNYKNMNYNFDKEIYHDKIEDEDLYRRVEDLKKVKSEKELRKEFPLLYEKYKEYTDLKNKIFFEIRELQKSKKPNYKEILCMQIEYLQLNKEFGVNLTANDINSYSKSFDLCDFCKCYAKTIEQLINNIEKVFDYLEIHSINVQSLGIDSETLELYISHTSMKLCENLNKEFSQKYIYYISNYFKENPKRKTDDKTIIHFNEVINAYNKKTKPITITPKQLYERYIIFLRNNPKIQVVDMSSVDFSGMTLQEVEEFMTEYLKDLKSNWDILPPDEFDKEVVSGLKKNVKGKTEEEKQRHKERLIELFMEKKEFYGSTDPFFRVKGKNTFDGYIGFIYTNGKVVLDKFYENSKIGQVADGEAIYIMNIEDFYQLSRHPKSDLMKNPKVKRIYHTNGWQEKVIKEITSEGQGIKTADEVQKLIKEKKIEE